MPTDSTRNRAAEAASTATRILDVAEQLFAESGYAAVSVRDIAGRVGLNQASLYNHFPSKQALYEAVLERGLAPIREILAHGAAQMLTPEGGDRLLERLVDQLWSTPHIPKLVEREMLDDGAWFESLAREWLTPIYDVGRQAMAATSEPSGWSEEEMPLVVVGMYHLLFGFFSAGALLRRVIGVDPRASEMRRIHLEFVKDASRRLMRPGAPT